MPFLPKFPYNQDEEQQKSAANISGSSTSFDLPGSGQVASVPKGEKKSGSWTNLNQYLNANKEQAGDMASKVTGDIDVSATDASNKINEIKAKTPDLVQGLSAEDIRNNYLNKADQLDDGQKVQYAGYKTNGGYTGPQSIYDVDGFNDAESVTSKADQKLKQSQTESGRQELLKDAYKRPTYTQGQSVLDNLLVQNDSAAKDQFNSVNQKWAGLTDLLNSARTDIDSRINENKSNSLQNKSLLPSVELSFVSDFMNPINERAQQFNSDSTKSINSVSKDLSDDKLATDTLAKLGLNEGQNLYDLNLNNYIKYDATQANANNVATANEKAKYAALMKLIGGDANQLTPDEQSINPISFDKVRFDTDVAKKSQDWKDLYSKVNPENFDRYLAANNISQAFMSGLSNEVRNSSLSDIENKILPRLQQNVAQSEAYRVYGVDPVTAYVNWVKDQNNLNRKIQKG